MDEKDRSHPSFISKIVDFPEGISYELLQPLTSFRSCHDGTPAEARIVFACRQKSGSSQAATPDEEFIIKIKVQIPGETDPPAKPETGPSDTTEAEIKALEAFRDAKLTCVPHLVAWKRDIQGTDGLLPGGYMTFTVMTKMPGLSLFAQYWSMPDDEQSDIRREFLKGLRSVYALGIEPIDRALRNILWNKELKRCSIIDFELWRPTSTMLSDETGQLQRWGLVRRPPPADWWGEWNRQER